ncbi:hypothetical protein Tco_1190558, partial [Tanacetum coccineum]
MGKASCRDYRRFLKKPHKWRRSLEFNGETINEDPPREFSRDAIMTQLARLPTRMKGKHPRFGGVKIKCNVLVELEYWSFLTLKYNLDVMHIKKNVFDIIVNTLLMNDKSKDTAQARQDLKRLEDDHDVIHVDNSSDLALSTSLNDLEIAALHIDSQLLDVDAPPDIIDVVDE